MQKNNCDIITGDTEEIAVPGGWGAAGQPNDGWHQWVHLLNRCYHQASIGWSNEYDLRTALDEIHLSPQGSLSTKSSVLTALRADAYALDSLNRFENGRLIWGSWITRGYITLAEIAKWRFGGNEQEARNQFKGVRWCTEKLRLLGKAPDMHCDDKEMQDLEDLRLRPLENEEDLVWATETLDGEGAAVWQPLPAWIAGPVERGVTKWVEEYQSWQDKIDERRLDGKELAPFAQRKYDEWQEQSAKLCLLFNKKRQCLAPPPRKGASMSRLRQEMFSLTIHLSMDATQLQVAAGKGEPRRLVVLKGEKVQGEDLPDFVDVSIGEGLDEALQAQEEVDEEDGDVDGIDGQGDEQEALLAEEMRAVCEDQDGREEVLAYSSEEEELGSFVNNSFIRVKSFLHRESYRKLHERGLAALPPCGAHISYHVGGRQWTGYYNGSSQGMCFSHGGSTKRSECEALLMCIKAILIAYTTENRRDVAWKSQLEKVLEAEATCATF